MTGMRSQYVKNIKASNNKFLSVSGKGR